MVSPSTEQAAGANATLLTAVATALITESPRLFLDARGADEGAGAEVEALRHGGWSGQSHVVRGSADEAVAVAVAALDPQRPVHLLSASNPVLAATMLAALSAQSIEPWLVAVAGVDEASDERVDGYRHIFFDGTRDVYVAGSRIALAKNLASSLVEAEASIRRWRASALEGWHARGSLSYAISAHQELLNMRQTLSWRVTRPLRVVRRRMPPAGRQ